MSTRDVERRAWRVEDVRAAEEAVLAKAVPGELMRRAAFALAGHCARILTERGPGRVYGSRVVLLVGSGNNGADALLAGAELARRGARVHALLAGEAHKEGLATFRAAGGRVVSAVELAESKVDLAVDGLVGIGGKGPLRAQHAQLVEFAHKVRAAGGYVVAVDVPSGVLADTGEVQESAVTADETITFGCLKPGLVVTPGAWRAGVITVVDIGLQMESSPVAELIAAHEVAKIWPHPSPSDSKYSRGVVGIVAGSEKFPGAAQLAVGGALRGGAGFVRYAGPCADAVLQRYPEVVCGQKLTDLGRVQAWVVGPGIGDDAYPIVSQILGTDLPAVLDADALTVFDDQLRDRVRRRPAPTILTPHEGEFRRMFGPISAGRIEAAVAAATDLKATLVLKGDRTIVAEPNAPVQVGPANARALATAGTGDVLAGLVGSLLATGLSPRDAASAGVYVHAQAGIAAEQTGPVTASDVVQALRSTIADLVDT